MSFHVIATIKPKPGKADRVLELLEDVAKYVKENEPGVLRYQAYKDMRAGKGGEEDVIMLETYKDKKALQEHGSSDRFKAFQKQIADEGLMREGMTIKMLNEKLGFASRL